MCMMKVCMPVCISLKTSGWSAGEHLVRETESERMHNGPNTHVIHQPNVVK